MKFCAKCGKKGDTTEGLCRVCYSKLHPAIDTSKLILVNVCESCKKVFRRNRWSRYPSLEKAVKNIVTESIKTKERISVIPSVAGKTEARIKISKTGEEYLVPVKIKKILCDRCRKDTGEYFEGVLQLRGVDEKLIKWVFEDLEKKKKEGVFVQNITEMKNGLDINLTSQKYLQVLAAKLKKRFKGEVKTTRRLFTRNKQTSRHVYRVTVLYKQKK